MKNFFKMYFTGLLVIVLFLVSCTQNSVTTLQGPAGKDGTSCTVEQLANGVLIKCGTTQAVVLNGEDGQPTSYSIKELVDPCGRQAAFDEVLLRLENNQLLAHYASGSNQFLVSISPGSYITTDNTHCYFTITNDYQIINEHN